jgi:SAM-dependent methyltransferase
MKEEQRQRIIKRHSHSIWLYGHGPQALYWESREVQELRFEVLLECGIESGDSVLDVGCGFADLYHYIRGKGLAVDYTGIDLSPDMIEAARGRSPELTLFQGDLFDFDPPPQGYDWVLLSGALNEPLQDDGAYVRVMLPRLFTACRKGLALNLLNGDYAWSEQQGYSLQAYPPAEIVAHLNTLSPYTRLRTDYLEVDASYFAWREPGFRPQHAEQ